ncbi:MAG: zinc-ribbon domain-containing protein [Anaerolineaceae bacterium]
MDTKIYHGNITPSEIAQGLMAYFDRGNYRVQQVGDQNQVTVQIATIDHPLSGGQTAMSVRLENVEDGISVTIGQQVWLGVAASLGATAIAALRNPFSLLGRLDDLAQDIESLQIRDKVIQVVESIIRSKGAGYELSERLRRIVCDYCTTANPVGEAHCIACGAPLGNQQPFTCPHCGFVLVKNEIYCPNCGNPLPSIKIR